MTEADLLLCGRGRVYRYSHKIDAWRVVVQQDESFYTYGVTWNESHYYFLQMRVDWEEGKRKGGIWFITCDKNFTIVAEERLLDGNPAPHQMTYNPRDKRVYACITAKNKIYVRSEQGAWSWWKPNDEPREDFKRRHPEINFEKTGVRLNVPYKIADLPIHHHLNSICFDGDDTYVMCHNKGRSEILRCVNGKMVERIKAGKSCHNVWLEDGELAYCDSMGERCVKTVSGKTLSVTTPGMMRGVARANGKRYVAVSPLGDTKELRNATNSWILVFDDDWNLLYIIDCPFKGEVYELRALAPDPYTHNGLAPIER